MAVRHPVSFASVARIWRRWNIQPHRIETFKFSTDPQLEVKLRDVIGLYLSPPQNAVLLRIGENTQIQALSPNEPVQPMAPNHPLQQTDDYRRHGTSTLFAALDVVTGKLSASKFYQKHTNVEFVDFLHQVAETNPGIDLNMVCDNYATHEHQNVKDWLAANPRVSLHFTPIDCSWLNTVEIFFGNVTRQCLERSNFAPILELEVAVCLYI